MEQQGTQTRWLFVALRAFCGFWLLIAALAVGGWVGTQVGWVVGVLAVAVFLALVWPSFKLLYAR